MVKKSHKETQRLLPLPLKNESPPDPSEKQRHKRHLSEDIQQLEGDSHDRKAEVEIQEEQGEPSDPAGRGEKTGAGTKTEEEPQKMEVSEEDED